METIVRNVRELDAADRSALERVVGHELFETQQVIVKVVNGEIGATGNTEKQQAESDVPDWWKIYEGLSDEAIDELDGLIRQRADLTRETEQRFKVCCLD